MTARPASLGGSRPRLRLVPGGAARLPKLAPWVMFTMAVLTAFFGLILSRTALDRTAFVLEELKGQIAVETARYQSLRLEVARLQSPQRVLPAAEEMGLVFPSQVQTVTAPGLVDDEEAADERWAELKSVLGAMP
ncbi:MAG: hypothetical protein M3N51_08660 [Actinomycetota bacterium]|nr:hypothetical protein [Actinomycetota bacterium]